MMSLDRHPDALSLDDSPTPSLPPLVLLSRENQTYMLSRSSAHLSDLLRTMLEGDSEARDVNLYHIEGAIVKRVVEYLDFHTTRPPRAIERPINTLNIHDLVDDFDAAFVDCGQENLFKLLLAANYLHIRPLIALCCAKLAVMIKGKNTEQIRNIFGIRHDATPQEEAEIAREYAHLIGG